MKNHFLIKHFSIKYDKDLPLEMRVITYVTLSIPYKNHYSNSKSGLLRHHGSSKAYFFFQIKTLRLSISYISYLTRALETDDTVGGFKAELGTMSRKSNNNRIQRNECSTGEASPKSVCSVSEFLSYLWSVYKETHLSCYCQIKHYS